MKANSECVKCGCRWHLRPQDHDVTCDRTIGRKVCSGLVIRDETREALLQFSREYPIPSSSLS